MDRLPYQHTMKISLVIPEVLLNKVDESSKAFYITRANYIRQALARAVEVDEPAVIKARNRYKSPVTNSDLKAYLDDLAVRDELEYE